MRSKIYNYVKVYLETIIIAYLYLSAVSLFIDIREFLLEFPLVWTGLAFIVFIFIRYLKKVKVKRGIKKVTVQLTQCVASNFLGLSLGKMSLIDKISDNLSSDECEKQIMMSNFILLFYNLPLSAAIFSLSERKLNLRESLIVLVSLITNFIVLILIFRRYDNPLCDLVKFELKIEYILVLGIGFLAYIFMKWTQNRVKKFYEKREKFSFHFFVLVIIISFFMPDITNSGFNVKTILAQSLFINNLFILVLLKILYSYLSNENNGIGGMFSPAIFIAFVFSIWVSRNLAVNLKFYDIVTIITALLLTATSDNEIFSAFVGFELYRSVNLIFVIAICFLCKKGYEILIKLRRKNENYIDRSPLGR